MLGQRMLSPKPVCVCKGRYMYLVEYGQVTGDHREIKRVNVIGALYVTW